MRELTQAFFQSAKLPEKLPATVPKSTKIAWFSLFPLVRPAVKLTEKSSPAFNVAFVFQSFDRRLRPIVRLKNLTVRAFVEIFFRVRDRLVAAMSPFVLLSVFNDWRPANTNTDIAFRQNFGIGHSRSFIESDRCKL